MCPEWGVTYVSGRTGLWPDFGASSGFGLRADLDRDRSSASISYRQVADGSNPFGRATHQDREDRHKADRFPALRLVAAQRDVRARRRDGPGRIETPRDAGRGKGVETVRGRRTQREQRLFCSPESRGPTGAVLRSGELCERLSSSTRISTRTICGAPSSGSMV